MNKLERLSELQYREKAFLLHTFFPEEMPALIDFLTDGCLNLRKHPQQLQSASEHPIITVGLWLDFMEDVFARIEKHRDKFYIDPVLFADQLFKGYPAIFCVHYLNKYVAQNKHLNKKFTLAVDLFFTLT